MKTLSAEFIGGSALAQLWLFIVAPLIGAALAGLMVRRKLLEADQPIRAGLWSRLLAMHRPAAPAGPFVDKFARGHPNGRSRASKG